MRSHAAARSIGALILREVSTAYGRTPGGYLWAVLEPIAAVGLLALVFSLAFDSPPLGRDFALFYASGYLPFAFYSDLAQKIGVALRFSRPLMSYPAVTWLDAIGARFVLNTFVNMLVAAAVVGVLVWWSGAASPRVLPCMAGLAIMAALGLGIGTLNAFLFEIAPVWERLWGILNRPAFILSGVLFLPDAVPRPFDQLIWLNPMVHGISVFRTGIYANYSPPDLNPFYAMAVAAIPMIFGLMLLRRKARDLLWQN